MLTLAQAKKQLNRDPDDTSDDEELQFYLDSTTSVVERVRGEAMSPREVTEDHEVRTGMIALNVTPVISLTSVRTVDGYISWDIDDLLVSPGGVVSTPVYAVPSAFNLAGRLRVVYQAGYTTVPANYQLAALIILQHLWQTQRGSMGGVRPGGLNDSISTATPGMGFAVPNRALELLGAGMPGFA